MYGAERNGMNPMSGFSCRVRINDKQQASQYKFRSPSTFPSRRRCMTPFRNDNSHYYIFSSKSIHHICLLFGKSSLSSLPFIAHFTISKCRYPKNLYNNIHVHN